MNGLNWTECSGHTVFTVIAPTFYGDYVIFACGIVFADIGNGMVCTSCNRERCRLIIGDFGRNCLLVLTVVPPSRDHGVFVIIRIIVRNDSGTMELTRTECYYVI